MLSLSSQNCAYYKDTMTPIMKKIESDATQVIYTAYPSVFDTMQAQSVNVFELCDYLNWAYYNSVELTDADTYGEIRANVCAPMVSQRTTEEVINFDQENNALISSDFLGNISRLLDITQIANRYPDQPHELPLGFTNYQTYTQDILLAIANAVIPDLDIETLPASSSLIFEIGNDGNIKAFLNDVEKTLSGCTAGQACSVTAFQQNINARVNADPSTACTVTSNHLIE